MAACAGVEPSLQMLFRHLHDQDGVLGRQTDQGHQTHLGVDVEIDGSGRQERQGAEHGQGHRHQDDHRGEKTFVLGGKHKKHHQIPKPNTRMLEEPAESCRAERPVKA